MELYFGRDHFAGCSIGGTMDAPETTRSDRFGWENGLRFGAVEKFSVVEKLSLIGTRINTKLASGRTLALRACVVAVLLLNTSIVLSKTAQDNSNESTSPPSWFSDRSEHPEDGTFIFVRTEKPFGNPIDAEIALQESCINHARNHIEDRHPAASSQILFDWANVSSNFVYKDRCLFKQYSDDHTKELNRNLGDDVKYYRGYAQLLISDKFLKKLSGDWRTQQTKNRLYQIALVAMTVLAMLTILFGYLRMQKLTRGFYTGHLRFISLAIAAALIIVAILLLVF